MVDVTVAADVDHDLLDRTPREGERRLVLRGGALGARYGVQSGSESLMSMPILPLNPEGMGALLFRRSESIGGRQPWSWARASMAIVMAMARTGSAPDAASIQSPSPIEMSFSRI